MDPPACPAACSHKVYDKPHEPHQTRNVGAHQDIRFFQPEMAERSKMSLLRKFSANRFPVGSLPFTLLHSAEQPNSPAGVGNKLLPLCSGMTRAVDQW